ncbi:hypothetical protein B0H14DRAFT_3456719 [Mycena olivaceomarginata]|nr:hypothetical protein B0H14DRAFT_3456719 [Mycena olivaceomarginata]
MRLGRVSDLRSSFRLPGSHALRLIENYRLNHQAAFDAINTLASIRHPGVVAVHEAFTTHAFGDSSLVVVYAYIKKLDHLNYYI